MFSSDSATRWFGLSFPAYNARYTWYIYGVYCKMGDHMLSSTCCQNQKKCPWDSFLLDPFFPFPERASFWKGFQTHLEIQAWLPLEYASEDSSAFFHQTQRWELPLCTQVIICTKHQWITHIIRGAICVSTPLKINILHIIMEVWFRSFSFLNGWWL